MGFPLTMKYKSEVYHKQVVSNDLSISYVDNVLCGTAEGVVKVMSMGIPGPFGTDFTFYYPDWKDISCPVDLSCPVRETDDIKWKNYLLASALSAKNGWGTSLDSAFEYISSDGGNGDYLEREGY